MVFTIEVANAPDNVLMKFIKPAAESISRSITHPSASTNSATWATANGWDLKALMTYVGWKDIKSAMRYIDPAISFGGLAARPALELNAGTLTHPPASH